MRGVIEEECGWGKWSQVLEGLLKIFFFFLGPHPWHIEVPRLGVESDL